MWTVRSSHYLTRTGGEEGGGGVVGGGGLGGALWRVSGSG